MAKGIRIIRERWYVYLEDDGTAVELKAGDTKPEGATVFTLAPPPDHVSQRLMIALADQADPKISEAEEVIERREERLAQAFAATARSAVVGWENLRDEDGNEVPYDAGVLRRGLLPFYVVSSLSGFVSRKVTATKEVGAAEKN